MWIKRSIWNATQERLLYLICLEKKYIWMLEQHAAESDRYQKLVRQHAALEQSFRNLARKENTMGHFAELQAAKERIAELEAAKGGSDKAEKVLRKLVDWFQEKDKRFQDRHKKDWSAAIKLVG